MLTTETTAQKLPPVECAPWCRDGDGHPDDSFPGDQRCWSREEHRIPLSIEGCVIEDGTNYGLGDLWAYASREAYSTRTIVHVVRNERYDQDVHLTVAEARQLAEALLSIVRTVEGA